jgi:hypothetical protein
MEDVQELDGCAEAEGRRLLTAAFETAPVGEALAGSGLAGAELLRRVRRRSKARRRARALVPAGAVAALGGAAALGVTLTATVASAPSAFAAVTAAAAKTSAESFQVTVQNSIGSQHILVTGEFDPAQRIGEETGPGGMRFIYTGQSMYVHLAKGIPGESGKTWLEVPELRATAATPIKLLTGSPPSVVQANPQSLLAMLESVGTVKDEGPASGPGWTGAEYSFTVTPSGSNIGLTVIGTVDVDQQGRVRDLAATVPAQQGNTAITVDITFSDFGAPVSVTPPPASLVGTMPPGTLRNAVPSQKVTHAAS